MHPVIPVAANIAGLALVALLIAIAFSSKRAMKGVIVIAGIGLAMLVFGCLMVSFYGLTRTRLQTQVKIEPSQMLFDTSIASLDDDGDIVIRELGSDRVSVRVVKSSSTDDDEQRTDTKQSDEKRNDEDRTDDQGEDDDDIWGEDQELLERALAVTNETRDSSLDGAEDTGSEDTGAEDINAEPDERPDWVFDELRVDTEPHRITVSIGPYPTWKEVDRYENAALIVGLRRYANWYLSTSTRELPPEWSADDLLLSTNRMRECIVDTHDYLHESPSSNVGDMPLRYVLLEFDNRFQHRVLEPSLHHSQSIARSKRAGMLSGGVLALLASAFGLLKLDSATAGRRRKLLRFAAAAVVGLVGLAGLLAGLVIMG